MNRIKKVDTLEYFVNMCKKYGFKSSKYYIYLNVFKDIWLSVCEFTASCVDEICFLNILITLYKYYFIIGVDRRLKQQHFVL